MSETAPLALSLTIRNATKLENDSPLVLVLDRRSATIGRANSTDWPLPDPDLHISSRHCDVLFRNGGYELVDNSTNGTFVNSPTARLTGPHRLTNGDVIHIGRFEVRVELVASSGAVAPPPRRVSAVPRVVMAAPPAAAPAPAPTPAVPAGDDDIWSRFAASNAIDGERGGFAEAAAPPPPPQAVQPLAPAPQASAPAATPAPISAAPPPPAPAPAAPISAAPAPAASGSSGDSAAIVTALLSGAGLESDALHQDPGAAMHQAGLLLRKLVAGMVVMLEARARAKSQMGAQSTGLEIAGNNPLKFARTPEQALKHVLNPPERGFMSAEKAIEDSFKDLQAHQLATLKAMQGALRSTLDRFSPKSIRSRAETRGLLEKILPSARDAAMWKSYEKEFSGVAFDSDEAFMDMFSKEFRKAYDDISRGL